MPYIGPQWVQHLVPPPLRIKKATSKRRRARPARAAMGRFTAVLLFEYNVISGGRALSRRLCEERVIVFRAGTAKAALAHVKKYGRAEQHSYKNARGSTVRFRFVGILDLLRVGVECGPEEVWYGLREVMRPMERRRSLIPPESTLNTIRWSAV